MEQSFCNEEEVRINALQSDQKRLNFDNKGRDLLPPRYVGTTAQESSKLSRTRYRNKYILMKRYVRDMIFTNAAICDEVVRLEEKLSRAKEDRRYLLRRLFQRESVQQHQNSAAAAAIAAESQGFLADSDRLRIARHQPMAVTVGGASLSGRPVAASVGGVSLNSRSMAAQALPKLSIVTEKGIKKPTNPKRPARPARIIDVPQAMKG